MNTYREVWVTFMEEVTIYKSGGKNRKKRSKIIPRYYQRSLRMVIHPDQGD